MCSLKRFKENVQTDSCLRVWKQTAFLPAHSRARFIMIVSLTLLGSLTGREVAHRSVNADGWHSVKQCSSGSPGRPWCSLLLVGEDYLVPRLCRGSGAHGRAGGLLGPRYRPVYVTTVDSASWVCSTSPQCSGGYVRNALEISWCVRIAMDSSAGNVPPHSWEPLWEPMSRLRMLCQHLMLCLSLLLWPLCQSPSPLGCAQDSGRWWLFLRRKLNCSTYERTREYSTLPVASGLFAVEMDRSWRRILILKCCFCTYSSTCLTGECAPKVPRVEEPASLPMNDHQDVEQQYGDAETESDHHDQSILLNDCVPSTSTTESCN